jgi:hypothetical protein
MAENRPAEMIARAANRTRAAGGARFELQIGERPIPWTSGRPINALRHPMMSFARGVVNRSFASRNAEGVIDLRSRRYMLFGAYAQLYADGRLWGGAPGRSLSTLSGDAHADATPLWLWELLDDVNDASQTDCAQVRGAQCRHLTASLNSRGASQMLPSRWCEDADALRPEIWIDENDHIRRIRVHADDRSQTLEFWEIGAEVAGLDWTRLPGQPTSVGS